MTTVLERIALVLEYDRRLEPVRELTKKSERLQRRVEAEYKKAPDKRRTEKLAEEWRAVLAELSSAEDAAEAFAREHGLGEKAK